MTPILKSKAHAQGHCHRQKPLPEPPTPAVWKRTVNEITPQVIEELRKSLSDRKPATVWNALSCSGASSTSATRPTAARPELSD